MLITISREFGSGGHSIGQKVAKQLGIKFYDQEIVKKVAKESGFSEEFITEKGEYIDKLSTYFSNPILYSGNFTDPKDQIFQIQRDIILNLAKDNGVIVGRCANYILKNEGIKSLNVFIYSDIEHRKSRILAKYGETSQSIEKRIEEKDTKRKNYVKYYTEEDWGDYHNYHLSLNSGILGEDECVNIIINTCKKLFNE